MISHGIALILSLMVLSTRYSSALSGTLALKMVQQYVVEEALPD